MQGWYSRPVFFVEEVERSIAFYVGKLGFVLSWRHDEGDTALVAQVDREGCEILLDCQQPEKIGRGRLFVSIDLGPLQNLRAEYEGKDVSIRDGWWGYDTMIVDDPDGNELLFPYPKLAEEGSN